MSPEGKGHLWRVVEEGPLRGASPGVTQGVTVVAL